MRRSSRRGFVSVAAALVIMAVMTTSFLAGVTIGHHSSQPFVIDGAPVPNELHQPLSDLWQGYQRLNSESYWRPFKDQKKLFYNAIQGMLSSTSDAHTIYIPPADNSNVSQQLNETMYGIGAEVQMTNVGLIISPLVDSPAVKAGLQPGDIITHVDGRDIRRLTTDLAVALIHGPINTEVTLTIIRSGTTHPFNLKVVRGSIPSVLANRFGSIGYVGFYEFGANTANEVHDALRQLLAQHITGLVLDLRDNPGGYVDTAKAIASEFLPAKSVLFWERANLGGGQYSDTATRVSTPGIAQRVPIVVLVNSGTASAAEILTAALREHGRARVVGATTYGKGSVQEDVPLTDGSALRITIHLWLTPQKHQIDGKGLTPDIVLRRAASSLDNQLVLATQLLGGQYKK